MGMTIEEVIDVLEYLKTQNSQLLSLDVAVETMHKYQKIEQILDDWKSDGGAFEMSETYWLRLISEVVEDGKID